MQDDMSILTKLVAQAQTEPQFNISNTQSQLNDENADKDVSELLRVLQSAEGIANGVEQRLDGLLAQLDGLLEHLESPQNGVDEQANKDRKDNYVGDASSGEM